MHVYSNLATTLDGKIATVGREFVLLGSVADLRLLRKLRDSADALVYGAEVLRAFRRPCLPLSPKRRLINAVLSRKLSGIDPKWAFFSDERIERILYITEAISPATRAKFVGRCTIVRVSALNPALSILRDLRKRGVKTVGVEGGGAVMWEFVAKGAIDRYYVTITPRIAGGRMAPTLVDGAGFAPNALMNLKLETLKRVGEELFLTYTPLRSRGKKHPLL